MPRTDAAPGRGPEQVASHDLDPQVDALVAAMRHHGRCNRIMGCPAADSLRALGARAVPAVVAHLRAASPKDQGWWLVELVRTLAHLGGPRRPADTDPAGGPPPASMRAHEVAREALESLLLDARDELRGRAALALGTLADPASRPAIERALAHWRSAGHDPAVVGALLFALERATRPSRALRRRFVALLPADEEQLGRVNAGALAILADVARTWDLPQAAAGLRIVARHRARPARLAAVRALGALRDTGALELLQARLDDEIPAIRRAAVRALQRITGNTSYGSAEEWKAWWARRRAHHGAPRPARPTSAQPTSAPVGSPTPDPTRDRPAPGERGPAHKAPAGRVPPRGAQGASRAALGTGSSSSASRGSGQRGADTSPR